MDHPEIEALSLSHVELRAALILAGKRIRKLSPLKERDKALPILQRALADSRTVCKRVEQIKAFTALVN